MLADVEAGASLRIRRGEQEVWVRHAPDEKPQIERFAVTIKEDRLVVKYKTRSVSEKLERWLQWSDDEGKTWRGLATGQRDKQTILDASALPGGSLLVRLLASDGFYTATSKPAKVELPERPPVVSILTPRRGQALVAGGTMRLWGVVSTAGGALVKVDEAAWILDGAKVGEGLDIFVQAPSPGKHELVLAVTSGTQRTTVSTEFATVELAAREK
jgi:hypothetical protein